MEQRAVEIVKEAVKSSGKTMKSLADYLGWSKQNLSGRMKNETLRFDEVVKMLRFAGYTIEVVPLNGNEKAMYGNSKSPKVVQMIDGTVYDTTKSMSICDSRPFNTNDMYIELFKAEDGKYFATLYQGNTVDGHNRIVPVTERAAEKFIATYARTEK